MNVTVNNQQLKDMMHNGIPVILWNHNDIIVWQRSSSVRMENPANPNVNVVRSYSQNWTYYMQTLSSRTIEGPGFEILSNSSIKVLYPMSVNISACASIGIDSSPNGGWTRVYIAVNGSGMEFSQVAAAQGKSSWNTYATIRYNYVAKAGDIIYAYCTGAGANSFGAMRFLNVDGVVA